MKNFCSTGTFVALSLLCAGPAVQQSLAASSPVAYVYLQTNEGINVYDASSTGALTLVKGSPFQAGGTWIEADNGKYMFTFDAANNIHTYAIESNGTIGSQVAEVYAGNYDGAKCSGETQGFEVFRGVLDHTGKSLYVQLFGYATDNTGGVEAVCSSYQYYQVGSNGKLTFNGSYSFADNCCEPEQNLTFTGSDKFVYGTSEVDPAAPDFQSFERLSNGALERLKVTAEVPPAPGPDYTWLPALIDADPNGHAAILGIFDSNEVNGGTSGWKIASYTVGGSGDLTTSNTYAELVSPLLIPTVFNFSPSGDILAAAGSGQGDNGGLQVFHWNGSKPPTAFGGALTDASQVYAIHWDNNNHLYAVGIDDKIYVYTITTSKVTAAGSPVSFTGGLTGQGLIVRPL